MDNFKFARHFGPWLSLRLWDLQPESGSVTDGGARQSRDLIMPPVDHDLGNRASTWSRTLWAVMNKVPAISSGGCRRSEGQRRGARKPKGRGAYLSRGTMVPTGPLDLQPGVPYYAAVAFQDPVIAP